MRISVGSKKRSRKSPKRERPKKPPSPRKQNRRRNQRNKVLPGRGATRTGQPNRPSRTGRAEKSLLHHCPNHQPLHEEQRTEKGRRDDGASEKGERSGK